eukprot:SAG11_NODE_3974_length_2124_cov_1.061637_1_plen_81_part_10
MHQAVQYTFFSDRQRASGTLTHHGLSQGHAPLVHTPFKLQFWLLEHPPSAEVAWLRQLITKIGLDSELLDGPTMALGDNDQ